jgi:hypothetical protein
MRVCYYIVAIEYGTYFASLTNEVPGSSTSLSVPTRSNNKAPIN